MPALTWTLEWKNLPERELIGVTLLGAMSTHAVATPVMQKKHFDLVTMLSSTRT